MQRSAELLAARDNNQTPIVDALRYNERHFRDLAKISSEWFWEQDAELRYTWFSDTIIRSGLSFDLLGRRRWDFVTGGVTDEQWVAHKAQLARHEPFRDFHYIVTGSDGVVHHINSSGTPIFDDDGKFCGYYGVGRDITAEVQAAAALRSANAEAQAARAEAERLRCLAEDTNRYLFEAQRIGKLGHWVTNEARKTVTWSPQLFEIAGLPPQPAMPFDLVRVPPLHPDDRGRFSATRERAIATGDLTTVEVRFVRADGAIRWVHVEMQAHYDEAGSFVSMFGTTQDITERKQAEDELKAARAQLVDAIESISESFVLFDKDDRYVLTNSKYRDRYPHLVEYFVSGTSYETMLRAAVASGIHDVGDDPEGWLQRNLAWHRACGPAMERELSDGTWVRLIERRTSDGGIVGLRSDITEQMLAKSALQAALHEAESASLAKSQFLANMSHELRTPLNAIIGFSEMIKLALRGSLPSVYREYGRLIHQSGEHLHAVINDILDLAKVDAGKFELRREAGVDPHHIADACTTLMRGRAEVGEIRLSLAADEALPPLVADPTRLKQILLNLLSNAIKFTPPGGSVRLTVSSDAEGGVAFALCDTGPGMTSEEIEIALEPFGQVRDRAFATQQGTGLGLPLARSFAELHGGSLRIDSEKGCGTTVTVTLPAMKREIASVERGTVLTKANDHRPP